MKFKQMWDWSYIKEQDAGEVVMTYGGLLIALFLILALFALFLSTLKMVF